MAEESTTTETTTSTEATPYSLNEYLLYKLDRTFAILGIIGIAVVAILKYNPDLGITVATGAISGLVGYIGGRTGK